MPRPVKLLLVESSMVFEVCETLLRQADELLPGVDPCAGESGQFRNTADAAARLASETFEAALPRPPEIS